MSYDAGFSFVDKKNEKKFDGYLWWVNGWHNAEALAVFKDFGEKKLVASKEETGFDVDFYDYIMPVSELKVFKDLYKSLVDNGVIAAFDDTNTNDYTTLDSYYFNVVNGWYYIDEADELSNNYAKYSDLPSDVIKEVRKGDLEYADELRKKANKMQNDFRKKLDKALEGFDEGIKWFIEEAAPASFFYTRDIAEMYDKVKKQFGDDCKLAFWESF